MLMNFCSASPRIVSSGSMKRTALAPRRGPLYHSLPQLWSSRTTLPVTIRIDAYPERRFRGKVDSIQSGSGARFSLMPPENATGNYVKVVQRVPVKIVFTEALPPEYRIGPGMSVVPEVEIR